MRTLGRGWLWLAVLACVCVAARSADTEERLKQLEDRNRKLEEQLQQQRSLIDDLSKQLREVAKTAPAANADPGPEKERGVSFGNVRIGGEGGVGVFHTSRNGRYANTDMRVDEAKLFVEAPLWNNMVFAYVELDLMTRERQTSAPADEAFHLGEAYVDFEGISRLWDRDTMLSLRAGRIDIPFGEEYLHRDAIDNPLISHSLMDFWGVDEGLPLYGSAGKFDYIAAVQSGGHPQLTDADHDKSIAARIGFNPTKRLRLSASAMRTGKLDTARDGLSEMWVGNAFFRNINPSASKFEANLYQVDARYAWSSGHVAGAAGFIDYSDNAPANNDRDIWHYYIEGQQTIFDKLYGAARFSQAFAEDGFPIVGHRSMGSFFATPPILTERMWRLSVGPGYQFSENLAVKFEYTLERRQITTLPKAYDTHMFAAEIAFSF